MLAAKSSSQKMAFTTGCKNGKHHLSNNPETVIKYNAEKWSFTLAPFITHIQDPI
ncbi:hypothetical protein I3843_02G127300 [Carya illinoinensis]|nr:hypothetical protein I3843_02G127300 [Carya illinoinensis]